MPAALETACQQIAFVEDVAITMAFTPSLWLLQMI